MLEFIQNNLLLIIIVGSVVLTFLLSLLLSYIIRKKQVKKDARMSIQKTPDFKKYHVKVINVEDVDISKANTENKNNNQEDNINIK